MRFDLRPARSADGPLIWTWRNAPDVRAMSHSSGEIALPDHLAWFSKALTDPARCLLIAEQNETACGIVRLDRGDRYVEVSIILAPDVRGQGLARPILARAMTLCPFHNPTFLASIRPENTASLDLFRRSGFQPTDDPMIFIRPKETQ